MNTSKDNQVSPFTDAIITLRRSKNLSVKQLAEKSDVAESTIFHMEKGRRCTIGNLRHVYYLMCENDEEYIRLLTLAAIHLDGNCLNSSMMEEVNRKILSETSDKFTDHSKRISNVMLSLTCKDRANLIEFMEKIPKSKSMQLMIKSFIEAK